MKTKCELPPVTDVHRRAAFEAMRWGGWTYQASMQHDIRRRLIEARATQIRTAEFRAAHQRSVVPVKRVVLGSDGHPVSWCTQMTRGDFAGADLFPTT
jgi:hypothetical protein